MEQKLTVEQWFRKIASKTMELIINQDLEEIETYEGDYSCFDQEETDIVNSFAF